jgi:hypothetical protein
VSRIGRISGVEDGSIGLERSDDFLRRTGPSSDGGKSGEWKSGIRDKSAISHGFVRSGAVWRVDIHGSWSNACSGAVTRILPLEEARRRLGCCKLVLERFLGQERQDYGTNRVNEGFRLDEDRAGTHGRGWSHARLG